jgi:agmatinase
VSAEHAGEIYGPPRGFAALAAEAAASATARAAVLLVPYDATTTFRAGTRDGPRAIVDASMQLELYDLELRCEPSQAGIHTLPELEPHLGDPEQMVRRVQLAVAGLLADGKLPLMLGGEHTLTAGAVAACAQRYPDLAILYLDAHADVRGPYLGADFNHASALRLSLEALAATGGGPRTDRQSAAAAAGDKPPRYSHAAQGPAVQPPPAVVVGIRSMASEEAAYVEQTGLAIVPADVVAATRGSGRVALDQLWAEALASLGPTGRPLYVSVDLDVFDPAYVAAVGTPEPGGLDWYEVTGLLRAAARRHPIVMADVMELAPGEGPAASAFTAAKLAYKLIGYALFRERLLPAAQ